MRASNSGPINPSDTLRQVAQILEQANSIVTRVNPPFDKWTVEEIMQQPRDVMLMDPVLAAVYRRGWDDQAKRLQIALREPGPSILRPRQPWSHNTLRQEGAAKYAFMGQPRVMTENPLLAATATGLSKFTNRQVATERLAPRLPTEIAERYYAGQYASQQTVGSAAAIGGKLPWSIAARKRKNRKQLQQQIFVTPKNTDHSHPYRLNNPNSLFLEKFPPEHTVTVTTVPSSEPEATASSYTFLCLDETPRCPENPVEGPEHDGVSDVEGPEHDGASNVEGPEHDGVLNVEMDGHECSDYYDRNASKQ